MRWLRRLWQKSLTERRLDSELQFHLEQQIAGYVSAGVPLDEARRRACIEFGGLERFKEECRETHWENQWDILVRDFRFALTCLRKDRRFAFAALGLSGLEMFLIWLPHAMVIFGLGEVWNNVVGRLYGYY